MTTELRIVIDPKTGDLKTVQLIAPDAQSQSVGFRAYQVISEEINVFSKKAAKLLRLERAIGRL